MRARLVICWRSKDLLEWSILTPGTRSPEAQSFRRRRDTSARQLAAYVAIEQGLTIASRSKFSAFRVEAQAYGVDIRVLGPNCYTVSDCPFCQTESTVEILENNSETSFTNDSDS